MPHVLVWDIETVPDLKGFAVANGQDGKTERVIVLSTYVAIPSDSSQGCPAICQTILLANTAVFLSGATNFFITAQPLKLDETL